MIACNLLALYPECIVWFELDICTAQYCDMTKPLAFEIRGPRHWKCWIFNHKGLQGLYMIYEVALSLKMLIIQ